jgi:hypothetical protein
MAITSRQRAALAQALGHLEARVEIAKIEGKDRPDSTARYVYSGLANAFPELGSLIDSQYLVGEHEVRVPLSEPCS